MRDSTKSRLEQATAMLEQQLEPVALLLFGSRADGNACERSDYDFGVYLGRPAPDPFFLAGLKTDLEDLLRSDADLVILDQASPIVSMEALRRHRMLCCHDRNSFADFVARTMIAYADLKRIRAPIEAAIRAG